MDRTIGQTSTYLYRRARQEFAVEATITAINGNQITIQFTSPLSGHTIERVLRSARERGRLRGQPVKGPGAPIGNQNAVKKGPKRIGLTTSLSGKRLQRAHQRLEKEGKPHTLQELRRLVYEAIDEYLG